MATTTLVPSRRQLRVAEQANSAALLEFESPTAAIIATPVVPGARGTIWVIASMFLACLVAAAVIPVSKTVTGTGRVVSAAPNIIVEPWETSIINSINVNVGQVVHAGDVLAKLNPTFSAADMAQDETQVQIYQAEVERLTAEADRQPYEPTTATTASAIQAALFGQRQAQYRAQMDSYEQKINALQATLAQADADIQGYRMRLGYAAELEQKRVQLEQMQVGSSIDRLSAEDNRAEMARQLADSIATSQQATNNIKEMAAERDGYVHQWFGQIGTDLTTARTNLAQAEDALRKDRMRHTLVDMRADQDAVVLSISNVSPGSVLQSGDQLMTLVPMNSPMEISAMIAGDDAGFVRPGEKVDIKFNTFPFITYGMATGTVRTLSPDSFTSIGDQTQRGSTQLQEGTPTNPYFEARIGVEQIKMHDVPGGFHLRPGMAVSADIDVGKRTVLEYLLARLAPVTSEGMREP
jgi:hemolysin D